MKTFSRIAILGIAISALAGAPANAALLYSGYTASVSSDGGPFPYGFTRVDALVNVSVYQNNGGNALDMTGDVFGLGIANANNVIASSAFGAAALNDSFLYLYQLVNTNFDPLDVDEMYGNVQLFGIGVVGIAGSIANYGFNDGAGLISVANAAIGDNPSAPEVEPSPFHFSSYVNEVASTQTIGGVGGASPVTTITSSSGTFTTLSYTFNPVVGTNGISALFGYTSSTGPTFGGAAMNDNGNTTGAIIVSALPGAPTLPVPGTALLFGSLVPGLAGFACFKRNRQVSGVNC